ncbi:hypothetical protein [Nocardioides sp. AE5]|nr:hypothetical protein [Nocardioides sp. AE5]MDT0201314.1 hypothetical protein [Nocardioides sp. AE5]
MNNIFGAVVGAVVGAIVVIGGVSAYGSISTDKASVPKIVNGSNVTYADE